MTLNEFQKLLAPHTLVSLWAGPSLMLWGGEIEACDFTRYGNREITTINLYNRNYYRGFLVYRVVRPTQFIKVGRVGGYGAPSPIVAAPARRSPSHARN